MEAFFFTRKMTDKNILPSMNFQPKLYGQLLDQKVKNVCNLLRDINLPSPSIFPSNISGFRMRAEFRIWHENSKCFYAMFEKNNPKKPIKIIDYPIASSVITKIMPPILESINEFEVLKNKLFQIEFLSSRNGECIVTFIYHKKIDNSWINVAKELEKKLNIYIVGRSRKQKICISRDFIKDIFSVGEKKYKLIQEENSFTQPNSSINQIMMNWICDNITKENNDLLELYCGNGNFTIPLSRFFRLVLATEIAKSSIKTASKNCQENDINNINFVRLSAAETAQALNRERSFRRLKEINLNEYNFKTILVDPPRSGLDDITLKLVSSFENILYISCNPSTLKINLIELSKTHDIIHFAIFDQFPYTEHCECGAILKKRQSNEK